GGARRSEDGRDFLQVGEEATTTPERAPLVEEDLERTPHRYPSDDVETLVGDLSDQSLRDHENQLAQGDADEEKRQADDQRNAALAKEDPEAAPGLVGSVGEVVVDAGGEIRVSARGLSARQVDDERQWLVERIFVGGIDDVLLGILVEIALGKGRRVGGGERGRGV